MQPLYFVVWLIAIVILDLGADPVGGQTYPYKPIRIVTAETGGSTDFIARLVAQGISTGLGQQAVVDNRGGAGGIIAAQTVSRAPADGYTLLLYGSTLWIGPLMRDKTPYDPVMDFSPVALVASSPSIVVVHPTVAANSVKELIALAKARPGELNYASGPSGSSTHLGPELFKSMAGVNIVRIAYKGSGPALNGLMGGEVQVAFVSATSVAPHIKAGRLRSLAVTSAQPSIAFPGIPTVAASGLPGYESVVMNSVFAPVRTPDKIINRLNQEIKRTLDRPDVKERFLSTGVDIVGSSPSQLMATMKSEMARMGKVIRDVGIRAE